MSWKFVSSISTTRCQALFGQSALHRSTINFQVSRMCSVKLHSTQFNTCYHSNYNVSVIIVCNNWTFAHCFFFFFFFFLSCCIYIYIYACFFRIYFLSTTCWWITIYIYITYMKLKHTIEYRNRENQERMSVIYTTSFHYHDMVAYKW